MSTQLSPKQSSALSSLTGEQRMYLDSAVARSMSASAALKELSAAGIGIRRTTGLAAYSALSGIRSNTAPINSTPFNFIPSQSVFTHVDYPMVANYRVRASVLATNAETGETKRLYAIVSSDTLLTRAQWLNKLSDVLDSVSQSQSLSYETNSLIIHKAETTL